MGGRKEWDPLGMFTASNIDTRTILFSDNNVAYVRNVKVSFRVAAAAPRELLLRWNFI